MAKRQTPQWPKEGQTTQWPKEKVQKDKQIVVCPFVLFLLAIVLSVFWPLCCLFFLDL
jgi:hypothetical protein